MLLKGLFPEEFRTFCRGAISVSIERFGGLKSLDFVDILEKDGHLYPDNHSAAIFTQNAESLGYPVFSPSIEFFCQMQDGTLAQYVPENADVWPDGLDSEEYKMKIGPGGLKFTFVKQAPGRFLCRIRKSHIAQGNFESHKNGVIFMYSCHCHQQKEELRKAGINPDVPFAEDGHRRQTFCGATFSGNILSLSFKCEDSQGTRPLTCRISSDFPLTFSENEDVLDLYSDISAGQPLSLVFSLADTPLENLLQLPITEPPERGFQLNIPDLNALDDFTRLYPEYQQALILTETEKEASIRAASTHFGFFPMWDHIYPIRDFIALGNLQLAEKLLRYICNYPHVEIYHWVSMQIILAINEFLAAAPGSPLLSEVWPRLKQFGEIMLTASDPITGLLPTPYCVGNDHAHEVGLENSFFASCINGWWYNCCRCMENFALDKKEPNLALQYETHATKIESYFAAFFLCKENGYLFQAVNLDGKPPKIPVFQNSNSLGLDYIHGLPLFRKFADSAAKYQKTALYHPLGHRALPSNSHVKCDMWFAVHMNQHLGHECKLARLGGYPEEAFRVMKAYMMMFDKYKSAIETFNLAGGPGNQGQNAKWQAFSATGAMQGLIKGILGIEWHQGGLFYIPANFNSTMSLNNLVFREAIWDIIISGEGESATLYLNGSELAGTLQVSADVQLHSRNLLEIKRTNHIRPQLLTCLDQPVTNIQPDNAQISFTASVHRHSPTWFMAPTRPSAILLDEKPIPFEWNEKHHTVYADILFQAGSRLQMLL